MQGLKNIAIIGAGNVGHYLRGAFESKGLQVHGFTRQVRGSWQAMEQLAPLAASLDIILLCVNDDAINELSRELPSTPALVVHVSGAMDLDCIDARHQRKGVFYPVMSLLHNAGVAIADIPFCLEAGHPDDLQLLTELASALGARPYEVNSQQRAHLHLAAVFAHNFSNHLFYKAQQIMEEQGLDFKLLLPLLRSAVDRLDEFPPLELQTGPARRGDEKTISKHLELLSAPTDKSLYQLLTSSIIDTYGKKL